MKTIKKQINKSSLILLFAIVFFGCEREITDPFNYATFPTTAEIFTDSPIAMGSDFYFPYGGSKATAWSVDETQGYESSASMRFDVPNAADPEGNFAGAIFRIDGAGRDLSNYDALTFWIKASQGVVVGELGFGEDFIDNKYVTTLNNVNVGTAWQKVIIPIPDASKLTQERGMFRYSAGTQDTNGLGYTIWIDELKFEKLGTIAQFRPFIEGGNNRTGVGFVGQKLSISNIGVTVNLPNGRDVSVAASTNYFSFSSSNASVASVKGTEVSLDNSGTTTITASMNGITASGSLQISATGLAPTPTLNAANVISVFSDAYTNSPVDFYNGYWAPWQNTTGQDDIDINGNKIINYKKLNFVGIEFQGAKTIDASAMTHFHMDLYVDKDVITAQDLFTIRLVDFGADKSFSGFNPSGEITLRLSSTPKLEARTWISIDVPFSSFPGLTARNNLAQIVFVSEGSNPANASMVTDVFIDNIYFHN